MQKITKYVLIDILRNRFVMAYTTVLLLISFLLFGMEDSPQKALLGLMNVVLFIIPLISLIFSTIYLYNTSEFIELMLCQPIRRKTLLVRIYAGLALSLIIATFMGIGIPVLIYAPGPAGLVQISAALILSLVFSGLALLSSILTRDRARGIGAALLLWIFFAFIFDGLVLMLLFQFADYPLEKPMIAMALMNPIDLARIFMLLQADMSAMLGFTGAIFQKFFGSALGMAISLAILFLWGMLPLWLSVKKFKNRDL
jgi:Cu-processing system permease protein